jgi:hypothetical protein
MNLTEINRVLLGAYHDPDLVAFMQDAREELGISWPQWLDQSGTLERLADAWWAGHLPIFEPTTDEFDTWRRAIRTGPRYDYARLCRAFRVPPVRFVVDGVCYQYRWPYGPSWRSDVPAATLIVFREVVRINAQNTEQLRCGEMHVCADFAEILRDLFPLGWGYSIQVGDGPVDERPFRA